MLMHSQAIRRLVTQRVYHDVTSANPNPTKRCAQEPEAFKVHSNRDVVVGIFWLPRRDPIVEAHRPTTDTDKRTNQPALVVLLHCVCTVQLTAYTRNSRTRQPRPTNSKQAYPEPNPSRVYIRGRGLDRRAFPLEPLQGALVLLHQRRHLLQNLLVVRVQPLFLLLI